MEVYRVKYNRLTKAQEGTYILERVVGQLISPPEKQINSKWLFFNVKSHCFDSSQIKSNNLMMLNLHLQHLVGSTPPSPNCLSRKIISKLSGHLTCSKRNKASIIIYIQYAIHN